MKKNSTYGLIESIGLLKMLKMMRFTLYIFLLTLSQAFAVSTYSQQIKLSLDMRNARVEDVIDQIEKSSEFFFMYNKGMVNVDRKVDIVVEGQLVNQVLDKLFENTDITYSIKDRQIMLINSHLQGESVEATSQQQKKTISGKVTDSSGATLPGVSVVLKGTTSGVITDIDGKYSLLNAPENAILQFSFVGMKAQEIKIGTQTSINVILAEETVGIEEVVAIGYGTMKKSDLTGAVMSVASDKFANQPINRIDQAIQGRAAGVQVTQTSGQPGAVMKIRIRGANSISGSNDPLYVVDGMVVSDIGSINVNDIEAMEVLKDASATAIYGSRGANGVVLVTSKAGKRGKPTIVFETHHGSSTIYRELPMMAPWQFAEGVNSANGKTVFTPDEISALKQNGGVDWQKELFKTAPSHNYQLSFSGGNDKTDYFISGNLNQADGTVINQNFKRYTLRTNINTNLSEKLKIGINISGARDENRGVRADLSNGLTYDPTTPIYNQNGGYNFVSIKGVGNGSGNPVIAPTEDINNTFVNRANAVAYLDLKISKNLVFNTSGGVNYNYGTVSTFVPIAVDSKGTAAINSTENVLLQNTNRLTYTTEIAGIHHLQFDAVHEQQFVSNAAINTSASQFFSDGTTYKNMALGAIQKISNSSSSSSLQSFLGRANYSYADKYLITASLRADASSKFRKDQRWGYFPSGSVAWRLSQEEFMKNISEISNLKLRGSYGITGSQAIGALATRSVPIISAGVNYPFTGGANTIGAAPSNRMANPDLTWEQTAQSNVGFDLGLWQNKLTLSVDAYKKITSNLLLDRPLPGFVGPTVVAVNVGKVENKGFEFVLGFTPLENKDWNITSNITFSRNINTVLELVNGNPIEKGSVYMDNTFPANPTRLEVGKSMGNFRGYQFLGVYQLGEETEAAKYGRKPGDAKYADLSGPKGVPDGIISSDDLTDVGNGNPKFSFGWNGAIKYRQIDLNFLVTGMDGNQIYNFQRARMMSLGAATYNATHADYLNRWTPTNPSNIPAGRNKTEMLSSEFIEDGSFVALKNITLGYSFKENVLFKRIGLDALKVYGSIDNAFILTKYTGFDPESTASGNSDVDLGIDLNTYPLPRTFTLGVKLTF